MLAKLNPSVSVLKTSLSLDPWSRGKNLVLSHEISSSVMMLPSPSISGSGHSSKTDVRTAADSLMDRCWNRCHINTCKNTMLELTIVKCTLYPAPFTRPESFSSLTLFWVDMGRLRVAVPSSSLSDLSREAVMDLTKLLIRLKSILNRLVTSDEVEMVRNQSSASFCSALSMIYDWIAWALDPHSFNSCLVERPGKGMSSSQCLTLARTPSASFFLISGLWPPFQSCMQQGPGLMKWRRKAEQLDQDKLEACFTGRQP